MFSYMIIGSLVAVFTDVVIALSNKQRYSNGITLLGAMFVVVFWPLVLIYLFFFLISQFFEALSRLGRKKDE